VIFWTYSLHIGNRPPYRESAGDALRRSRGGREYEMCTLPNSNSASLLSPAVGPVLITDGPNSRQHVESLQPAGDLS
jgi:hypothetical protein